MTNIRKRKREVLPAIPGFDSWLVQSRGSYALSQVMMQVSAALHVETRHLRAKAKPQWITDARQIYCFFARNLTRASYNEIAMKICCMHPSVITAERNIRDKLAVQDEKIVEKINLVYQQFMKDHPREFALPQYYTEAVANL